MRLLSKSLLGIVSIMILAISVHAENLSGPAPGFSLKTIEGKTVQLSDYKGQVVMINFWASWCGPCREEMPLLEAMYSSYKKAGFVLLGITIDENINDAKEFLGKSPVTFPILSDNKGKVASLYKNRAMPSSYFIDRQGNLAYLHKGYRPGDEKSYKSTIKSLLAK